MPLFGEQPSRFPFSAEIVDHADDHRPDAAQGVAPPVAVYSQVKEPFEEQADAHPEHHVQDADGINVNRLHIRFIVIPYGSKASAKHHKLFPAPVLCRRPKDVSRRCRNLNASRIRGLTDHPRTDAMFQSSEIGLQRTAYGVHSLDASCA